MATTAGNEFLSFSVGAEEFCIEILKVREIRGFTGVTKLPNSPVDVPGVINLRGVIVPLIDLRVRFGTAAPTYNGSTIVIVVVIDARVTGIVVDGVSEVIALQETEIKPPPAIKFVAESSILGMATLGERMITVLDIDRLLSWDGLGLESILDVSERDTGFAQTA